MTFQDNTGLTQPSVRSGYLCDDQIQKFLECPIPEKLILIDFCHGLNVKFLGRPVTLMFAT